MSRLSSRLLEIVTDLLGKSCAQPFIVIANRSSFRNWTDLPGIAGHDFVLYGDYTERVIF